MDYTRHRLTLEVFHPILQTNCLNTKRFTLSECHSVQGSCMIYSAKPGIKCNLKQIKVVTKEQGKKGNSDFTDYQHLMGIKQENGESQTDYYLKTSQVNIGNDEFLKQIEYLPMIYLGQTSLLQPLYQHQLQENDFIIFGACLPFKVIKINTIISENPENEVKSHLKISLQQTKRKTCESPTQCRICLSDDSPETLINPCECKGSCEYVHFQCLKDWIIMKIPHKRNSSCLIYMMEFLKCEICKSSFKETQSMKNSQMNLFEIKLPNHPYVLLEKVITKNTSQTKKDYVMLIPALSHQNQSTITIGRSQGSHFMFNHESISHHHASINFREGDLFLTDKGSRNGTKIFRSKSIKIDKGLNISYGDSVYSFEKAPKIHRRALDYLK